MIVFQNKHVTVFQSPFFQTNSTVIETDDCLLIVDPTYLPHEIQEIQEYVEKRKQNKKVYLFITHGDFDHIVGYSAFPDAICIGSIDLKNHPQKEKKIEIANQFDRDFFIERNIPFSFPELDIVIYEDGHQVKEGNTTLTFYTSPGHTKDGLFAVIEELGIWIVGDYLSNFELPFAYYSVKDYFSTLDKATNILNSYQISLLVPGHGKVSTDPKEIEQRINVAKSFLLRLKEAVLQNDVDEINKLEKEILFPSDFTRDCHQTNIQLIKEEYTEVEL